MRPYQPLDAVAELGVAGAGLVEVSGASVCRVLFERLEEDGIFVHGRGRAGEVRVKASGYQCAVGAWAASPFPREGVIMPHPPAPGDISRPSQARSKVAGSKSKRDS